MKIMQIINYNWWDVEQNDTTEIYIAIYYKGLHMFYIKNSEGATTVTLWYTRRITSVATRSREKLLISEVPLYKLRRPNNVKPRHITYT